MTLRRGAKDWTDVRTLAALLAKTAKAARLYPPAHDARRRLTDEAFFVCHEILERAGTVSFTIEPMRLLVAGTVSLEVTDREEPIPGKLWSGGIRELTLERGVTAEDFHQLLLCLYQAEAARTSGQDDLSTLLWIANLRTIRHRGEPLSADTRATVLPDDLMSGGFQAIDAALHDPTQGHEVEELCQQTMERVRSRLDDAEPELFVLRESEKAALREELAAEEAPAAEWAGLAEITRRLLLTEREPEVLRSLVEMLRTRLHAQLSEGTLAEAADVATILRETAALPELDPEAHAAIDRTLSLDLEPGVFSALIRQLDVPNGTASAELDRLCQALPPHAISNLCEILGQLETAAARYRVIECLIPMSSEHIDLLSPFLRDPRWYLVRNVALILGEIGNAEAVDSLRGAMRHQEPRVRKEVLKAVGQLGGYKARGILAHALKDRDPALRTWAARNLANLGVDGAAPLREILEEKDFARRGIEEQRAFYEAYAYAAREEAVAYLASLLEPRGLFRARLADHLRAALLQALGWAGGPVAESILETHRNDRSPELRSAAETGLARLHGGPELRGEAA